VTSDEIENLLRLVRDTIMPAISMMNNKFIDIENLYKKIQYFTGEKLDNHKRITDLENMSIETRLLSLEKTINKLKCALEDERERD